jgi:hypothetical protein
MSDTPETDAASDRIEIGLNHYWMVDAEFAQKLERERDEARQATRQWIEAWDRYGDGASMMHPRLTMAITAARKSLTDGGDTGEGRMAMGKIARAYFDENG